MLRPSKRDRKSKVLLPFFFFFFEVTTSYRTLKSVMMWEIEPVYKVMLAFLIFLFKSVQLVVV